MTLFDQAFEHILKVEGDKYTDNPRDNGGPTKYGITLRTYNDLFGNLFELNADPVVIQSMTRETARSIYKTFFWYRMNLDRVGVTHPKIALIIFDQAVNRGIFGVTRMIQNAINDVYKQKVLVEDGVFGEKTLIEIAKLTEEQLGVQIFKNSQLSYVRIVKNSPEQIEFLEGWIKRTHSILDALL